MPSNHPAGIANDAIEITPNDGADLSVEVVGLIVAAAGNVKIDTLRGSTITFYAAAGVAIPIGATKVYATGTAATGIVGLIR